MIFSIVQTLKFLPGRFDPQVGRHHQGEQRADAQRAGGRGRSHHLRKPEVVAVSRRHAHRQ